MTTPVRVLITGLFAIGLVASLGACSMPPLACPAIGFIHTATLDVRGSDPAALRLCIEDSCAASNDQAPPDAPLRFATPGDLDTSGEPSPDTTLSAQFTVMKMDVSRFAYSSGSALPRVLEATALDATGTAIGTTTVHLDWKRVGGSEQCGGPNVAHATLTFGGN